MNKSGGRLDNLLIIFPLRYAGGYAMARMRPNIVSPANGRIAHFLRFQIPKSTGIYKLKLINVKTKDFVSLENDQVRYPEVILVNSATISMTAKKSNITMQMYFMIFLEFI
ncbi:MAG: hypothetical protein AAB424_00830 [Patescibacteria group bacterium]